MPRGEVSKPTSVQYVKKTYDNLEHDGKVNILKTEKNIKIKQHIKYTINTDKVNHTQVAEHRFGYVRRSFHGC